MYKRQVYNPLVQIPASNTELAQNANDFGCVYFGATHITFSGTTMTVYSPGTTVANRPERFNPANRGAWYAALGIETCIAEVGHHLTLALADVGDFNAVVEYGEMLASMSGVFVDLRDLADHPALDPDPATGYAEGNAVAARARADGHNGVIYPSVRHTGGTCVAALWPNVVQSVVQGAMVRLTWSGNPEYVWEPI